jgi:phage baseplate assembly protein W
MADLPHFALPFRFDTLRGGERAVPVTEQDTNEEIGDCVELTLRTEQGQRQTMPSFGRPESLAFTSDRQLVQSQVQNTVDEHEPRVRAVVQQADLNMYELNVEEEP